MHAITWMNLEDKRNGESGLNEHRISVLKDQSCSGDGLDDGCTL